MAEEEFLEENKMEDSQEAKNDRVKKTQADRWHNRTISHAETVPLLAAAFKDNISNKRVAHCENPNLAF